MRHFFSAFFLRVQTLVIHSIISTLGRIELYSFSNLPRKSRRGLTAPLALFAMMTGVSSAQEEVPPIYEPRGQESPQTVEMQIQKNSISNQSSDPNFVGAVLAEAAKLHEKTFKEVEEALNRINFKAAVDFQIPIFDKSFLGIDLSRRVVSTYEKEPAYLIDSYKFSFDLPFFSKQGSQRSNKIGLLHETSFSFAKKQVSQNNFKGRAKAMGRRVSLPLTDRACEKILRTLKEKATGKDLESWERVQRSIDCRLPLTAKDLKKMKTGDQTFMKRRISFVVSSKFMPEGIKEFALEGTAQYLVSGEFWVQLKRLRDPRNDSEAVKSLLIPPYPDRFVINIVAAQERAFTLDLQASMGISGVSVLAIRIINGSSSMELSPLRAGWQNVFGSSFLVSYNFDIENAEVAKSYDEYMTNFFKPIEFYLLFDRKRFGQLPGFRSLKDPSKLHLLLTKEIQVLDHLAARFEAQGNDALVRSFGGRIDFDVKSFFIEVGHRLLSLLGLREDKKELDVVLVDSQRMESYYHLSKLQLRSFRSHFYRLFGATLDRSSSLLLSTDSHFTPTAIEELTFEYDLKDQVLRPNETRAFRNFLKERLPSEIYEDIQWGNWAVDRRRSRGRIQSRLSFRNEALTLLGQSLEVIWPELNRFVSELPDLNLSPLYKVHDEGDGLDQSQVHRHSEDLSEIAQGLIRVVRPPTFLDENDQIKKDPHALGPAERKEQFLGLLEIPLWREIGASFLSHLIRLQIESENHRRKGAGEPRLNLSEFYYFEADLTAKGEDPLKIRYGQCETRNIYSAIEKLSQVIDRTDNDLSSRSLVNDIQAEFRKEENCEPSGFNSLPSKKP